LSDPNAGLISSLRKTLPWVRFLSLVGFFFVALFGLLAGVSWMGHAGSSRSTIPGQALIVYPAMMIFTLVPAVQLHKCARKMSIFVAQGHTVQLEEVLEAQRGFWMFLGGFALLTGLVLLGAIAVGVLAAL
jgi:hypothetical protein